MPGLQNAVSYLGQVNVQTSLNQGGGTNRIACGNAVGILPISWDGKAVNCVMDVDAEYICGDVNKESIKDIWNRRNEQMVKYHFSHEWEKLPAICHTCNDWSVIGEERFDPDGNPILKSYEIKESML